MQLIDIYHKNCCIAIDAFPYKSFIHDICDYSGEQVYIKASLPLFKYCNCKIENYAAESYDISSCGKLIRIKIRKDLYWHTGEHVKAIDYVRAFKYIASNPKNRYFNLFEDVKGWSKVPQLNEIAIRVLENYVLEIELKYPNVFFMYFMTLIQFSPMHKNDINMTAGPYYIKEIFKDKFHLEKNPYYQIEEQNKNICENIIYSLHNPHEMLNLFMNKKIDVTCDTATPFKDIVLYNKTDRMVKFDSKLIMLLSAGNLYTEVPLHVKEILSKLIDKVKIATSLGEFIKPIFSYTDMYFDNHYKHKATYSDKKSYINNKITLLISYEDFYPNLEVIKLIIKQIKKYGIKIHPCKEKYGTRSQSCHFRLEIRTSSIKQTPILLYKADLSRGLIEQKDYIYVLKLYSYLLFKGDNLNIYKELDKLLINNSISIPLINIPSFSLVAKHLNPKSIYTHGFINIKEEYICET